jgi:DNA replication protein DnaC
MEDLSIQIRTVSSQSPRTGQFSATVTILDAKREGTLARKLRWIDRFELILIDELGYVPFEREATDLLFQVISQRYER